MACCQTTVEDMEAEPYAWRPGDKAPTITGADRCHAYQADAGAVISRCGSLAFPSLSRQASSKSLQPSISSLFAKTEQQQPSLLTEIELDHRESDLEHHPGGPFVRQVAAEVHRSTAIVATACLGVAPVTVLVFLYSRVVLQSILFWDATQSPQQLHTLPTELAIENFIWLAIICPVMCCFVKVYGLLHLSLGYENARPVLQHSLRCVLALITTTSMLAAVVVSWMHVDRRIWITVVILEIVVAMYKVTGRVGRLIGVPEYQKLHLIEEIVANVVLWGYSLWIPEFFFASSTTAVQRVMVRAVAHPMLNMLTRSAFRYVAHVIGTAHETTFPSGRLHYPMLHFMCQISIWGRFLVVNINDYQAVVVLAVVLSLLGALQGKLEPVIDYYAYKMLRLASPEVVDMPAAIRFHIDSKFDLRISEAAAILMAGIISLLFRFSVSSNVAHDPVRIAMTIALQLVIMLLIQACVSVLRGESCWLDTHWRTELAQSAKVPFVLLFGSQTMMFLFFFTPFLVSHADVELIRRIYQ